MTSSHTITTWQRLRRNSPPALWAQLKTSNPCTPDEMDPPTVAKPVQPTEAQQTQAFYAAWSAREQANRKT